MDQYILIDRVRNTGLFTRLVVLAVLAIGAPLMFFMDEAQLVSEEFEAAQQTKEVAKKKYDKFTEKIKALPALEEKLASVEKNLNEAKKYLPASIEFDEVLALTGRFEKEVGVSVTRFAPKEELRPNPQIQYAEVPVEIVVRADFIRVMNFFDRLTHTEKIMHLRDIIFEPVKSESAEPGTVEAKAQLILFRATG
ncbi:MAG: type 4a pilus biogenesis protein PilO [Oligoflexales bacterium]